MTVAESNLPAYLARIFMDFQGEPDDQKRAAAEAANISQDDRILLKKALEDYGYKVHPLSRLARLIRAGANGEAKDEANAKGNGNGEGPTTDPALNEVIERVQKQIAPPQVVKRRRTAQAKWGDAEWEFLIERVAALQLERPGDRLPTLARQAQERLAPHSRRKLNVYDMRELAKRLIAYNQAQADKQAQLELDLEEARLELETRRAAPTRDEILTSLADDELVERFAKRLLSILPPDDVVSSFGADTILACLPTPSLVAFSMGQLFSEYATHSKLMEQNLAVLGRVLADMPTEKIRRQTQAPGTPAQLPKVLLVGFKPEQGGIIADRFHGRVKVETQDKNRKNFSGTLADIIVVLVKFVPQTMVEQIRKAAKPPCRVILHTGGLETVAQEIERILAH
jgi:GGDEF domain-containing protein